MVLFFYGFLFGWFIAMLMSDGIFFQIIKSIIFKNKSKDLYGIKHILLNLEFPNHSWLNFGYWKDIDPDKKESFSIACSSLAKLVGDIANIQTFDKILDIGYGCGDQILLWNSIYNPKYIVGITNEISQFLLSKNKINTFINKENLNKIRLFLGDAIQIYKILQENNEDSILFDKIICLDSAYHFNTRKKFLQQSFQLLKLGGKIVLTDIVLNNSKKLNFYQKILLKIIFFKSQIPNENIVTLTKYIQILEDIGFKDINVECIEENVWKGFIKFIDIHSKKFNAIIQSNHWIGYKLIKYFLSYLLEKKICHYIVISAIKI